MRRLVFAGALIAAGITNPGSGTFARDSESPSPPTALENAHLRIVFHHASDGAAGARMDVLDKLSARVWKQADTGMRASGFQLSKDSASFDLTMPRHPKGYRAVVRLEPGCAELVMELHAPPETPIRSPISFPPAFESAPGDRIIVPLGEGISFPVEITDPPLGVRPYYSGHGITMAFFAVAEDRVLPSGESRGGPAYMTICETPDNSGVELLRNAGSSPVGSDSSDAKSTGDLLTVRQVWGADRGRFGYPRRVRFVFLNAGGHVAICKRYRQYARQQGLVVPFAEKMKRNPARKARLERLFGAANIWVLSGEFRSESKNLYDEATGNYRESADTQRFMDEQLAIYRDMRGHGMDRLLIGAGSDAAHLQQINAIDGALSSRYDIYQDVMDPAQYANLTAIKNEWPKESFPHDLRLNQDGSRAGGWQVPLKTPIVIDGKETAWVSCNQLCDRQALPYARKRIANELEAKPYLARFIDVTACSTWSECWSPGHPTTRSESRRFKADLLALPGNEFNLVLGSETGHEAFVPSCDYFEGMMSLAFCRVPDSGRNMVKIWDEVPAIVAKYQTGESYRLPLFELIYHDCVVSYWYWGDYNNKLPALWAKRDLFNALYGTPPMYVVSPANWPQFRERIFASYRVAAPVSKLTAQSEMTDHRILTRDRTVQQASFANGVRVTVNFGDADYPMPDGFILKSGSSRTE